MDGITGAKGNGEEALKWRYSNAFNENVSGRVYSIYDMRPIDVATYADS